ncbi:MAG: DUF2267 domain-containing protein [Actinobacteria bacterium]|nr:DUF2267 domain-containing protein [Actinomycetota bacterium]
MTKDEFIDTVKQYANIDSKEAERITSAVLLTLRSRLSPEEVTDISENLPDDVEGMWEGGWLQRLLARIQSFREMDRYEFLEQVRQAADLPDLNQAERLTEIVFSALKTTIPQEEVEHISRELPEDLRGFWKAA